MRVVGRARTAPSAFSILSFDNTSGYSWPTLAAKRFTLSASCASVATPTTSTSGCARANAATSGISAMHGTHHVAQKFTTTQRPLSWSSRWCLPLVSTRSKDAATAAPAIATNPAISSAAALLFTRIPTVVYASPDKHKGGAVPMAQLSLSAPTERAAPPPDLEIRPKQVKTLIQGLPMGRPLEAGGTLLAHISSLNRVKVDLDDRLAILDLYRPVVVTLFDELDAIYGRTAPPLNAKARDALMLARSLAAEIAGGYKIVLLEKTGKRFAFGVRRELPLLVLGTMRNLAAQLMAGYKSYSTPPKGVWSELHHLYLFADAEGFANESADPDTKETIHDAYTEAL